MTSPLLVQPDPTYRFSLTMTADQFFAAERDQISGRAAGAVASSSAIGLNATAAVDVTAMQQYSLAVAEYQANQRTISQKQQLLDDAAKRQYAVAMAEAAKLADPTARATAEAAAAKQLAQGLSGPAADASVLAPTPPAALALPAGAPITNVAAGVLPALAASQSLYAASTPNVTGENRAAILMAAGDVATNAILSTLLDPGKLGTFTGRQVLWGVTMVAVNPGWKTRKGYAADLESQLGYWWVWARPEVREAFLAQAGKSPIESQTLLELQRCVIDSLAFEGNVKEPRDAFGKKIPEPYRATKYEPYLLTQKLSDPVVAAVSPMGDAQALDLQASGRTVRQQAFQMAFALASAGLGAQANTFLSFAKSKQLDIETRTSNVVVSARSGADGAFGFRFNPRVAADPATGSDAAVLQVPTFPTLLVIGMHQNELRPRVVVTDDGGGPRCFLAEPRLTFRTFTRWSRTEPQCSRRSRWESPCYGDELTEEELYRAVANVQTAYADAKGNDEYSKELERRKNQIQALLTGSSQPLWLPVEILVQPGKPATTPKPVITLVTPTEVLLERHDGAIKEKTVQVIVVGTDLDQIDAAKVASPGGKPVVTAKYADKQLHLTVVVDAPGTFSFVLPTKDGNAIATPALVVRAPTTLVIDRNTTWQNDKPTRDTIIFSPGVPTDVVKSEIEKNKFFPADVKVDVRANSSTSATKGKP